MKPGQKVEIKLDAFGCRKFEGRLDSFSPASGAQFSLLPPDNATGNFTKVVQRIPVKFVFDAESIKGYESRIAPGMSATVNVELKSGKNTDVDTDIRMNLTVFPLMSATVQYSNPCRSRKFFTPPQPSPRVRGGSKKFTNDLGLL
ncbi:hypothetical protein Q5692_00380 [Microcoleus sp. C2C3]|uniref:HlyD family secretion protein n=1 Tax=unclassified Microcoleus TaxID=2642155 RepID=UPI002FD4D68A